MCAIHKNVDGIDKPLRGNCFYNCVGYKEGKPRTKNRGPSSSDKHKRKGTKRHKLCPEPSKVPTDEKKMSSISQMLYYDNSSIWIFDFSKDLTTSSNKKKEPPSQARWL